MVFLMMIMKKVSCNWFNIKISIVILMLLILISYNLMLKLENILDLCLSSGLIKDLNSDFHHLPPMLISNNKKQKSKKTET
jgi:hypothetical protein